MSDDDRFVGRAGVPPPSAYDPPTEPLMLVPQPPRRRWPVGLVAALVAGGFILLLLGVMTGWALRFGGVGGPVAGPPPPAPVPQAPSPTPPPDTPKAATERFLTAVVNGDEAAMRQNTCKMLRGEGQASPKPGSGALSWLSLGRLASFKVGEEKVAGPGASVDVQATFPIIGETKFSVYLLREEGGWRVCGGGPA